MIGKLFSHMAFGGFCAIAASAATYVATRAPEALGVSRAAAQAAGSRQTEVFKTTMEDVLGRTVRVGVTERDPGNASGPHRHPGSHTIGYVLEGTYEVKINDGPVQRLGPGGVFYEQPNALHAISRNGSATDKVKYLTISISDPSKPQTVAE
jgi:quercetin dioxygenase-like cupin family protein